VNLSNFERPSRYIGNEVNIIKKGASSLLIALAFPDIYDVGMSHLGLKILYKIINDLPYASAERVFHPWIDLEGHLKTNNIHLTSLESGRPLKDFDIVGFSLQYELSFTSVLNMLSLSAIPLRSDERKRGYPLVIAGGPCTVNPLPMSPFIDAFLVGDGEEAIKKILDVVLRWKNNGGKEKNTLLKSLSEIEGVYVPGFSTSTNRVFIESLDDTPYPTAPIVPYTQIVHDRINVEISRGCPMGCRFCQASMIYRPVRERSPENALKIAGLSMKATGCGEVSFTSLSAGDYTGLLSLLRGFNQRFLSKKISISLPSLRVKAVRPKVLREIKSVHKTGFTIAPEAATERLRAVINKDFNEEDYERAIECLFKEGWLNLKLYYMIGLPTETHTDIEAIPNMVKKALKTAKKYTKRFVNVSVSISPFVPKPHTPFQWFGQQDIDEIRAKRGFLKASMKGINIKGHDERMSLLEAAFARGDEGLAPLIEQAWKEGVRLDGWSETFDFNLWLRAMEKTSIDAYSYAKRRYETTESLPWEIINTRIKKEFLKREYDSALMGERHGGCMESCPGCGLGCKPFKGYEGSGIYIKSVVENPLPRPFRLRAEFSKTSDMRYLSHRELMNLIERALRRVDVLIDYTKGFHPSPKIAFGPPLSVGVSGLREYFDIEVLKPYDLAFLKDALNSTLPDGVRISRFYSIKKDEPSLQSFISRYEYEIICPEGINFIDAKDPLIERFEIIGANKFNLIVKDLPEKKVRLDDIIRAIFGVPASDLDITRTALYGLRDGRWQLPLRDRVPVLES